MKHAVLASHAGVATVTEWAKEIGQYVGLGDPLLVLRTDDGTVVPIASPAYGVLFKCLVLSGEAVEAGEPLAVLAGVTDIQRLTEIDAADYIPVGPEERFTPELRWQRLAEHHAASLRLVPQVYTTLSVDLSEVTRLQGRTQAPFAAFAIAATAAALKRFPLFNAAWLAPDDVRLRRSIHVALPQPDGTFPVIEDAEKKSVMALARALATVTLLPTRGGSFTLTLGEALSHTPILHQPQCAHLYLSLSGTLCLAHDARVADSFLATAFLQTIRDNLQEAHFLFV